jgi:carbamoyl-phosphate synthase large subunit
VRVALKISKNEALSFAKQLENPIFQPYIEGKEWSIDLYRSKEGEVKGCVARLRDCVIGGESQVTTTVSYPLLENYCIALANQLNIYGHAVVQVIEDEKGQFHIIECNLRFGGASTASLAVGLDSFYWFFVEALGRELKHYPFHRHQQDIRQIRYSVDKVIPWSSSLT